MEVEPEPADHQEEAPHCPELSSSCPVAAASASASAARARGRGRGVIAAAAAAEGSSVGGQESEATQWRPSKVRRGARGGRRGRVGAEKSARQKPRDLPVSLSVKKWRPWSAPCGQRALHLRVRRPVGELADEHRRGGWRRPRQGGFAAGGAAAAAAAGWVSVVPAPPSPWGQGAGRGEAAAAAAAGRRQGGVAGEGFWEGRRVVGGWREGEEAEVDVAVEVVAVVLGGGRGGVGVMDGGDRLRRRECGVDGGEFAAGVHGGMGGWV